MRATELARFKKILLARRQQLTGTLTNMKDEALKPNGAGQDVDDIADFGSDQFEQELTLGLIQNEQQEISEIDAALDRIESKSYGVCESCSDKIPKPRLVVVPAARYCVACQEHIERFGRQTEDDED